MHFMIIIKVTENWLPFDLYICQVYTLFFILLRPESVYFLDGLTNNDDFNNPWNLIPKYYQTLDNGTITSNVSFADESINQHVYELWKCTLRNVFVSHR